MSRVGNGAAFSACNFTESNLPAVTTFGEGTACGADGSELDITIVSHLPAANLPLGDEFEPGPVKMVRFEAAFRRGSLRKQDLEHAPGNAHHSLIFAARTNTHS